jgi:hypothetical protein
VTESRRAAVTWRNRIAIIRPYTLPMLGLTAITAGVSQYGWGPGLICGGLSALLLEQQRRVDQAGGE